MSVETLPRLGFLGVGWIGRNRMEAVHRAGAARVGALADLDEQAAMNAAAPSASATANEPSRGASVTAVESAGPSAVATVAVTPRVLR